MTREEAKELLLHILMTYEPKDQYGDYDDPEPYEQALTMAIEVLSNYITEKPNDAVEQKNDAVAEPTDLISRKELLDRIKAINSIPWCGDHGNAVKLVWSTEKVKRLIEKAPSADRPSGEWIKHNDRISIIFYYTCSECGEIESGTPPYCRKCGAKMKGEK